MTDEVISLVNHHIGVITLNRAKALNALNFPMILALQAQLNEWKNNPDVHAVVVQSAEPRAFCAGGDVRAIYHHGESNYSEKMEFFSREYQLNQYIYDFDKPYIALMNGITMGGGAGISLHGSHPVAATSFQFAMPETGIGFYPDIGSSYFLSRCPGYWGVFLGLTGYRLGAFEAQALGLVRYVVAAEQFPAILNHLITTDLSNNAHQIVNEILQSYGQSNGSLDLSERSAMIDSCFQYTTIEAILSALKEAGSEWYDDLLNKAPLSLKVTLAQLRQAKSMPLAKCLAMDYCLTSHFMRAPDFDEGVRALLIEKDNKPQWQPRTLSEITDTMVNAYFV